MKKRILLLFLVLALLLPACGEDPSPIDRSNIPLDADGAYLGFGDVPEDYTPQKAVKDGCLVIDIIQEPNAGGVMVSKETNTYGYEHWQDFASAEEEGRDAFLRVVTFIDGIGYYKDLYYRNKTYTLFEWNEYGIFCEGSFRYLRRLDGMAGPVSDPKEDCFYVLTDSLELTYHDVSWSYLSSGYPPPTDIPFEWLGFMIYFE